ncbi:MAG: hypothetical protein HKN05_15035 [Rhizobiales bacterium]|nr:hypothetical protein [Hyphomicrobiales bacterium]
MANGSGPGVEELRALIQLRSAQINQLKRDRARAIIANVDQSRFEKIEQELETAVDELKKLERELRHLNSRV